MTQVEQGRSAFFDVTTVLLGVLAALGCGYVAVASTDSVMAFHVGLMAAAAALAAFYVLTQSFKSEPAESRAGYFDGPIKVAVVAAVFWGIAGFLVGDIIAWQMAFPALNFDLPWTSFGRLRPLHTSAVIFAFGGNVLLATSFYVVQRTSQARMPGRWAPYFVVWGFQLFIAIAGTGYILGVTQGKEYAEPEWYADAFLTVIWVVYLLLFLATLAKRKEPHIYVANWFYLAFIVTVAMLHIVNNMTLPVSIYGTKSYILFAGVQDAMTQWWYGHNAVGFFLTAGFLGIMYYFIPKRVERPGLLLPPVDRPLLDFDLHLYLGRAAPPALHGAAGLGSDARHDILDHAVDAVLGWHDQRPDDAFWCLGQASDRSLWSDCSLSRWPSTGCRRSKGPLMSIKAVNSLSHYTDWTIGHVHSGALGWVAMVSFGAIYCLVPWLWRRKGLYSLRLVEWHFWISTHRHPALHHGDVGVRHPAGSDVACLRRSRLPAVLVHRDRRSDAALLHDPGNRRTAVRPRRLDHGLQHLAHHPW